MHSWLIVPADSEAKLARVPGVGADAVVFDLGGAIDPGERPAARERTAEFLASHRQQVLAAKGFARWVRVGPLASPWWREDLLAVLRGAPDGIVLAGAAGPGQVQALAAELYELEPRAGAEQGSVRIVPEIGGSVGAAFAVAGFVEEMHPRVAGLAWNAAEFATALGVRRLREPDGGWSGALRQVRVGTLVAARARGLMAIDTAPDAARDLAVAAEAAREARADGFTGIFATHPGQLPAIAEAFAPTAEERAEARAIVALFEASPYADFVIHRGRAIDRARLELARRMLGS
jgi:citrate lyase subunit beta/citryl-CoA lyase